MRPPVGVTASAMALCSVDKTGNDLHYVAMTSLDV
jgi:hypothetical protein